MRDDGEQQISIILLLSNFLCNFFQGLGQKREYVIL